MTITTRKFMNELERYRRGSVTRRHFLGVTGLGLATTVLSYAMPDLKPRKAYSALSGSVNFTTWPNYYSQQNLDDFTAKTGVAVNVATFGSNEEMLAKLQAGSTGWDVVVSGNYTISTYKELDLIEPLDLTLLPNYDQSAQDQRFLGPGTIDGTVYAVPKDWGTTGFVINTKNVTQNPKSWKDFWDLTQGPLAGRVAVHDFQLTTIGNALKYFGYSFNSNDEKELMDAEKLLIASKPSLYGINSDYQPWVRNGEVWMTMAWNGEAVQLNRDIPEIQYVIAKEGGEIWVDHYTVPKGAQNREAAYALIDFLLTPEINAKEVRSHGFPSTDSRANKLVPKEMPESPILYPAKELLDPLEFSVAQSFTNPQRAEIMARFKAA